MAKRKISKRTPKNVVPKHVQWHPGFVTGIELDFDKHREGVTHEKEYNLNTKPLAIDVLIRKKEGVRIEDNEIGRIFRRYNIVEYKSPDDHMDIDTYYKVNGYACLFKSYGEWMDAIKAEEVTISLFPVQIVVTGELDIDKHIWLVALSGKLTKQQMEKILEKASQLTDEREKRLADSVLQVCVAANSRIVEELKEENLMCQALREIMKPELEEMERRGERRGEKRGEKRAILVMIKALRQLGQADDDIKGIIIKNFHLKQTEVEEYIQQSVS